MINEVWRAHEALEDTEEWRLGMLEDHWDAMRDDALEEE